jgi:DNA-directed RNA polymerase specialized sigma24 family protein
MTTLTKTNAVLPVDTAANLKNARDKSATDFQAAVIALRANNWPLRAIADVFDVTRVAAKAWHERALQNPEAVQLAKEFVVPSLPLSARGSQVKAVRLKPDVHPEDRERIRSLAVLASTVRRWTPQDSPERRAARELEALIKHYVDDLKVSPSTIAAHAGVSRRAIAQRLEKARRAAA